MARLLPPRGPCSLSLSSSVRRWPADQRPRVRSVSLARSRVAPQISPRRDGRIERLIGLAQVPRDPVPREISG